MSIVMLSVMSILVVIVIILPVLLLDASVENHTTLLVSARCPQEDCYETLLLQLCIFVSFSTSLRCMGTFCPLDIEYSIY